MTPTILALRLSRRAIGAAVLKDEQFTFYDGRHLPSGQARLAAAARRYLDKLLGQTDATVLFLYAPCTERSLTAMLVAQVREAVAATRRVEEVSGEQLRTAFGVPPLRTARELRDLMGGLFPESATLRSRVTPYVLEAAAVAAYADCAIALTPPLPP